jgi:hypothetical protein
MAKYAASRIAIGGEREEPTRTTDERARKHSLSTPAAL